VQYEDFEIKIETEAENQHTVSVIRTPSGEARTALQFGLSDRELSQNLATLEQLLDPSEAASKEGEQSVELFGKLLFGGLMREEMRSLYDRSQLIAKNRGKGLRLKLRIQSAQLAALPWELLYDERQGDFISLSRQMSIVRYVEVARAVEPIKVEPPLQILGMVCSPKNLLPLDVVGEKQRVQQATEQLQSDGLVELTWLQGNSWRDLMRAMRRGSWHIFHYIGHSGFDAENDEGYVSFCDSDDYEHRLNATQLGRLLRDHKSLQLALLNSCQGAKVGEEIFSSTASTLVRQGIPCVIGMQYDVSDEAAIEFSNTFYELLAEGAAVETAVAEARQAISLAIEGVAEWGTPVFYTHAPDSVLFEMQREIDRGVDQLPSTPRLEPGPKNDPAEPHLQQGEAARLRIVNNENLYDHKNLIRLRNILEEHYNIEELKTVCSDLGIDYENLGGEGKAGKARELINYLKRHQRMADLIELGLATRPEIPWLVSDAAA
jgi:hypothetical protein